MKRIQYHRYGGPEELHLEEVKLPEPDQGQVRVRVKAAGVNPMDWGIRRGKIRMLTGRQFPRGLGHDFAGVVEAVGPGSTRLKIGDEVFSATGMKQAGAFAEVLIADEKHVLLKPASLSFEQAAALTIVSVTAWTALIDRAKLRAGQSVFIGGCLGGVGRAAVQIALMHGATVSGSCSKDQREEAVALGVREVVDYRNFDVTPYKGRFDIVLDTPAAFSMSQSGAMLKRGGHAVYIDGISLKMLLCLLSPRHLSVIANPKPETMAGILRAAEQGKLVPKIGLVVPLSDAIPAITKLETTRLPKGKLVIVP
jgi:NADPH:quinone reductase-like Zn-dependent oxidoreductase